MTAAVLPCAGAGADAGAAGAAGAAARVVGTKGSDKQSTFSEIETI